MKHATMTYRPLTTDKQERVEGHRRRQVAAGLLFGVAAGVSFVLATWVRDGLTLAGVHGVLPWLKLGAGGLPVLLLAGMMGALTVRLDSRPAAFCLWLAMGAGLAWWVGYLPLHVVPAWLARTLPELAARTAYLDSGQVAVRIGFAQVSLAFVFGMLGLFVAHLVDDMTMADAPAGWLAPLAIGMGAALFAGLVADSLINDPFRAPVEVVDHLIEAKLADAQQPLSQQQRADLHLAALDTVTDHLTRPRRILLADYDDSLALTNVLIDFDGILVNCSLFELQPGVCTVVE